MRGGGKLEEGKGEWRGTEKRKKRCVRERERENQINENGVRENMETATCKQSTRDRKRNGRASFSKQSKECT